MRGVSALIYSHDSVEPVLQLLGHELLSIPVYNYAQRRKNFFYPRTQLGIAWAKGLLLRGDVGS